ncbi:MULTISPECIES: glycoside-pentoside-hexuronide (GPH):cation symporter [Pseudoalteromonas]|uniref:Sugar transporter n=1 Tax=Pseudoalteromonas amylolytica TaxID=1859457 RepID=A0A1S1MSE2_9GAMM|nr:MULTISPECIES: glycoside-pentoside-hexuronide (GPH):cation symporter [Pseudoalteromonas]OHU88080.1 sugar transporter [Pseudoalteromonas sp. JW3]OHU91520.1 sugar transporter [Pseudoalteromonas amylolytica]
MLTIKEKIAYGLGDTASNLIFQTVMMFLLLFYTDVMGLEPALVGTLFLVVRIFDAVTDPLMGAIADRTHTKFGQYRPYLLWLCVPFALISVLAFTTPQWPYAMKATYAFVTYALLMLVYTAINIPYSALGGVMTKDPLQRVSLQSYRFVFGMLGGLIIAAGTIPLVELLGKGDVQKGYQLTMALMGVLGMVLFLFCFAGTKERVKPNASLAAPAISSDFKLLFKNSQWRILSLVGVFLLTGQVLKASLAVYYVKYYLQMPEMVTPFVTLGMVASILGCACSSWLASRICKVKAYISLQVTAALLCALAFFVGQQQWQWAFALFALWSFFLQMATPLLWAMMADTIDYGHLTTKRRVTGMVYSSVVFFIKLGIALGGAIAGWLLSYFGYQADVAQSEQTQYGISLSFSVLPAFGSIMVAYLMRNYLLDGPYMISVQTQLSELKRQ